MTPHERLIEALTVERYTNPWWEHGPTGAPDTDQTRARRRHSLDQAWRADNDAHPDRRTTTRSSA